MDRGRLESLAELEAQYASLEEQQAILLRQLEDIAQEKKRIIIKKANYAPVYSVPDDVLFQILEEAFAHEYQGSTLDYHCDTPLAIANEHQPTPRRNLDPLKFNSKMKRGAYERLFQRFLTIVSALTYPYPLFHRAF